MNQDRPSTSTKPADPIDEVHESLLTVQATLETLEETTTRFTPQRIEDVEVGLEGSDKSVFLDGYDESGNHWVETYRYKRSELINSS